MSEDADMSEFGGLVEAQAGRGADAGNAIRRSASARPSTVPEEQRLDLRVCGYRRCGAPLPSATGRGNRARFCQDGKTWGSRNLNCRDAEAVLLDAESLRSADTALEDTAVTALAEHLDRAMAPTRALLDTLATLREQLDSTVIAATTARDTARADADEQRRSAGLAEAAAVQARADAAQARSDADDAREQQDTARKRLQEEHAARVAAEQECQRAEGRADAARDDQTRAATRAEAATARAEELATTLATLTANLNATQTALTEERARSQDAIARAAAAERRAADLTVRVEELHGQLTESTTTYQQRVTEIRGELDHHRAAFDSTLAADRVEHEHTIRSLNTTITELHTQLRAADGARGSAEHATAAARDRLTRLRGAVGQLTSEDLGNLPARVHTLLALIE